MSKTVGKINPAYITLILYKAKLTEEEIKNPRILDKKKYVEICRKYVEDQLLHGLHTEGKEGGHEVPTDTTEDEKKEGKEDEYEVPRNIEEDKKKEGKVVLKIGHRRRLISCIENFRQLRSRLLDQIRQRGWDPLMDEIRQLGLDPLVIQLRKYTTPFWVPVLFSLLKGEEDEKTVPYQEGSVTITRDSDTAVDLVDATFNVVYNFGPNRGTGCWGRTIDQLWRI